MITPRKRALIRIHLRAVFFLLLTGIVLFISLDCLGIESVKAQGVGPLEAGPAGVDPSEVEQSYHGQLGYGTGLGMVDKWCPLSYFKFDEEEGVAGWVGRKCDECHVGAKWNPNKPDVNCLSCHPSVNQVNGNYVVEIPTIKECYTCHIKDTEKRGDLFDPSQDVHLGAGSDENLAAGFGANPAAAPQRSCQYCHSAKNHQIGKGEVIDTSEPTKTDPVVSCTMSGCHSSTPHTKEAVEGKDVDEADRLDQHCQKVACETCHTDNQTRSNLAMLSRDWTRFKNGKPLTQYHETGWVPEYKWYDGTGPSPDHKYVPILDYAERKDSPGAKIYPFNVITVTWFIKSEDSDLDDIIVSKKVKAAGKLSDPADPSSLLITTEADMRAYDDPDDGDSEPDYPRATIITREMNFNLSHSIVSKDKAPACTDCHGKTGRKLLDWKKLGYTWGDPRQVEAGR